MKIILIGIVGSGKSTQGNLLSKQLNLPYLSTGHIFREIAKEKTKLGKKVKLIMAAGLLQPDELTVEVVEQYLKRPEYKKGYILDGFPRTLKQVKLFKNNVDRVIYLDIPDKEALWRLAFRNDASREDDTIDAIKKRIEVFFKSVKLVIEYYEKKGILITIDGTNSIEEINAEILKSLGKQLVENRIKDWKKKQKSIIAIVGLPGAGKTEAAHFFAEKKLPIITFGKIINEYIDRQNLPHTEEVHKKVREEIRAKHGKEALAFLNKDKIKKELSKNEIIVIDGMRSWEEYSFLKKEFPKVQLYTLCLYADKQVRYKRIHGRKDRATHFGEERDMNELIGANMGPTIAYADFLIKNNFSKEDLEDKLEDIYRIVYFS